MAYPLMTRVAILATLLSPAVAAAQVEIKLTPTDGAQLGSPAFGASMALDGSTVVIGAGSDDDNGLFSGSAYLFDTTTGSLISKLVPADGATGDFFGESVGISGNTVIVGAPGDDDAAAEAGSVYLFDATTGLQTRKLLPDPGTVNQAFGSSVAIDGTTALVGAPGWGGGTGRAFLYDTTTGALITTISTPALASPDGFGAQVAIEGSTVLVSAAGDWEKGLDAGAAYLMDVSGGTPGVVLAKLLPSGPAQSFGHTSVDIDGSLAIVGASSDADNGAFTGAAYLFDSSTGALLSKITPADAASGDRFGSSVGISGGIALVGARRTGDYGAGSGSAYLLDVATGAKLAEIRATDATAAANFGRAVAIQGTTAVMGAPNPSAIDPNGAAYLYDTDDLPGMWSDLGGASAGIDGLPTLRALGRLTPGSLLDIDLTQAAPNSLVLAWLSFTSTPLNILGGTIYANPFQAQFLRFTPTGSVSDSLVWPAAIPAGIDMYLQFLVNDVTVPSQITLSNAVTATTP